MASGFITCKCRLSTIIIIAFYQSVFINSVLNTHRHNICKHQHPKYHDIIHGVYIEPAHTMRKRSIDQPLRILTWYDDSVYRLDNEKFKLINSTILPKAIQFWEEALYVRKVENAILLTRKCNDNNVFIKKSITYCIESCKVDTMCGEIKVPDEHLDICRVCNSSGLECRIAEKSKAGRGITGYDFVFYVSAIQTERCNKSLTDAYAAHCQQEISLDRPIAGHANICPKSISTKSQDVEILLSTVKHEIIHALGFSVSLFGFYRDNKGNPLTPRRIDTGKPYLNEKLLTYDWSDKVIKKITRKNWSVKSGMITREIQMVVTPRVVEEVRRHFNCSDLEGAELEDQGEEGTVLTHWEKRVFENEAMTGTHTQNPTISNITLALLEDTGWYRANYEMAEPLNWGRNLGCTFVMKSCKEWMTEKAKSGLSIHPFCDKVKRDPLQTECTDERSSVALCNLIKHDYELPLMYQNFAQLNYTKPGTENYYGGSVTLADYCPYIQEFSWISNNIVVRESHCHYEDNNPQLIKNFALEKYGKNSKCFEHGSQMWEERSCRQMRQWQHWGSGCYEYRCKNGRLYIIVAYYTYPCFYTNQEIPIQILIDGWLHAGTIVCPSCEMICRDKFSNRKEECKADEKNSSIIYATDELRCGSTTFTLNQLVFIFLMFLITDLYS